MTLQSQQPLHIKKPVDTLSSHPTEMSQTSLALEGMTCASCAMRIEKGLKKVPGVIDASVNLATERGTVTYDPAQTGIEQLVQKVEAVGYKATPLLAPKAAPAEVPVRAGASSATSGAPDVQVTPASSPVQEDEQSERKRKEIARKRNLLLLGIALTLPVVILSMFFMNRFPGENLLLLALTTLVWAVVGW
jgi:Cu+-exporting ATPase